MPPGRERLLLHVTDRRDPQRLAVTPTLAAAAERAGWAFECYVDERRRGRHFGGGDPSTAPEGWAAGTLVAGGAHVEQVLWLTREYDVHLVGDEGSVLWPILLAAGAQVLLASVEPAEVYQRSFEVLGLDLPTEALVVDGAPQGDHGLVVAPFLAPAFLDGPPVLGLEVSAGAGVRESLQSLGVTRWRALYCDSARTAVFGDVDEHSGAVGGSDYAALTASLAREHVAWAQGALLGDPHLVSTQVARVAARRLVPLYGTPQTDVVAAAADVLRSLPGTVFGRQYDDHDFFALAPLGHGLQLVDPGPPFEALRGRAVGVRTDVGPPDEVDDEQLARWADEGRVLATLLFWSGMVRELDCVPRIIDLIATTGARAGLVLTSAAVEQAPRAPLSLLGEAFERGGVHGHLELLAGSIGKEVAPEALLPSGVLASELRRARETIASVLPEALVPRGWWPIMDAPLVPIGPRRVFLDGRRPVLHMPPRVGAVVPVAPGAVASSGRAVAEHSPRFRDLRGTIGQALRRSGADDFLEGRGFVEGKRPYDWHRPGPLSATLADDVADAGFEYMWTKTAFGTPELAHRRGDFVAVPLTAGVWGGWTPFYTADRLGDLKAAERRLVRSGRPGWLATTLDGPLWLGSGEVLERGHEVFAMLRWLLSGGSSGRLVNATPAVVARYARLLDDRAASR